MSGGGCSGDTYRRCTVEQWEKKAELALLNGDMGQAMRFAHYANLRSRDTDTEREEKSNA